jgi:hypothetical protein
VFLDLAKAFLDGGLREIYFYVATEFAEVRVRCFVLKHIRLRVDAWFCYNLLTKNASAVSIF